MLKAEPDLLQSLCTIIIVSCVDALVCFVSVLCV